VPTYSYTMTTYDVDQPWLICSTSRDSVELEDGVNFHDWARERWPSPRYGVKVDPAPFRWAARD
jgi:hypothetical protein